MTQPNEFLNGTCRQLLFSPEGGIEGVLLTIKGRTVHVRVPADIGASLAWMTEPGKRLRVIAVPDSSPEVSGAIHPVYEFHALADEAGRPARPPNADLQSHAFKGVVAALHFGPDGQANGVVLDSGEFILLRAQGMSRTGLKVGAKVRALGEIRMTLLGTRMMNAVQVNGIDLQP